MAAVGSYLQAKAHGGVWLVRMEDLDHPRELAGAANDILRTLEKFGLFWDGSVMYQNQRTDAYQAAVDSFLNDVWQWAMAAWQLKRVPRLGACRTS